MIYKLSDLNRKNFNAIEFYGSRTARLHKIENTPNEQATLENLDILADKAQEMRDLIEKPIHITSGYRSLELNRMLIGSSSDSYHMYGLAFDFVIGGMTPVEICKFFINKIRCDKMIASYLWDRKNRCYKKWVHVQINNQAKEDNNYFLLERIKNGQKQFKKLF
tara:strand:+ start:659 stop:1150 length:492 start_codon:yes stop_codon:yes gene_type:complete